MDESSGTVSLPVGSEDSGLGTSGRVIVVDDDTRILDIVARSLGKHGYDVEPFADPEAALSRVEAAGPGEIAVVVSDLRMPGIGGLELAEKMLEADPEIQVIVITAYGDEAAALKALRLGVVDYLPKPFEPQQLASSVQRALFRRAQTGYHRDATHWLKEELERARLENAALTVGVLSVLVNALEARSEFFVGHSQAVADVAEGVALALGLDQDDVRVARSGGLLHDIGMISVPDRIVEKQDKLDEHEYALLQLHCQRGADMLDPLEGMVDVARAILEHHERIDGSGYPLGLGGDRISVPGQVVGLAETWVALLEDRPYRSGVAKMDAHRHLVTNRPASFDRRLVDALRRFEGLPEFHDGGED